MSIKSGVLLNKENLNAAFMSKLENNNILGNLNISATDGILSSDKATIRKDLSVGTTLNVGINAIIVGTVTWSGGGSANANAAHAHVSSDGSSHGFINQNVTTTASPTFGGLTIAAGAGNRATINAPTSAGNTLTLGRFSGSPSIKSTETWLMLEGGSTTGKVGLNYYATGDVILAKAGGKVGVGTETPVRALDVAGDIRLTANIFSSSAISFLTDTSTAQAITIGALTASSGYVSGNVGIGIAAAHKLHVSGDALTTGKTMIGNASTYFDLVTTNTIHSPNDLKIDKNIYVNSDTDRLYFGTTPDTMIGRNGANILRIGNGTDTNNLQIPKGYLSLNTAIVTDTLNVGGNIYAEGGIKYNDVSRYWLSIATNWGLYWNTADNKMEFHGAGASKFSVDLDDGNTVVGGTLSAGALTVPSASITTSGLNITNPQSGDGGWTKGIVIENTGATTGEASIAFKNAGTSGTGLNYWIAGLNQGTDLSFVYNTSFVDPPKMKLATSGNLTVAGELYSGTNKVWHEGNLVIEPIESYKQEFTATANQTVFNLSAGPYTMGRNLLSVYIWGSKQPPEAYTETSITSFTLKNGVPVGTKVLAEWYKISPNLKGDKGDAPEHEWLTTQLRFKNTNGTWGTFTDLKGDKGDQPSHGWSGTSLRFQNPNASWGSYTDLKGAKGDVGTAATINLGIISFLEPNATGYITNAGNTTSAIFNIGIPKGSTVALHGTPVTVLNPNLSPTITNTGANGNSILQFGLPRAPSLTFAGTPVTVLNPNQNPTITNSGSNGDSVLTFGLPKAPAVTLGTVTTLAPGVNGTITNTGSNGNVIFNFGLPTGKGITNIVDNGNGTITLYYGEGLSKIVSVSSLNASSIPYSKIVSGMTATNVQAAIDEIDNILDNLSADAANITYNKATSGLASTNVQGAIDELAAKSVGTTNWKITEDETSGSLKFIYG